MESGNGNGSVTSNLDRDFSHVGVRDETLHRNALQVRLTHSEKWRLPVYMSLRLYNAKEADRVSGPNLTWHIPNKRISPRYAAASCTRDSIRVIETKICTLRRYDTSRNKMIGKSCIARTGGSETRSSDQGYHERVNRTKRFSPVTKDFRGRTARTSRIPRKMSLGTRENHLKSCGPFIVASFNEVGVDRGRGQKTRRRRKLLDCEIIPELASTISSGAHFHIAQTSCIRDT